MKLKKLMFATVCSALTIYGLSSFVSSGDDANLFNSPLTHAGYLCPAVTVTSTISYHNSEIVCITYSNGTMTQGTAWGQSVTSTSSGSPTTYPAFFASWRECLAEPGLGCTPCPPIKACTIGC